jgi:hypothetical protein
MALVPGALRRQTFATPPCHGCAKVIRLWQRHGKLPQDQKCIAFHGKSTALLDLHTRQVMPRFMNAHRAPKAKSPFDNLKRPAVTNFASFGSTPTQELATSRVRQYRQTATTSPPGCALQAGSIYAICCPRIDGSGAAVAVHTLPIRCQAVEGLALCKSPSKKRTLDARFCGPCDHKRLLKHTAQL